MSLTLVFSASVCDLLHEGHLNLLRKMRERGDLTAMVLHDGYSTYLNKGKFPVESLEKRAANIIDTGLIDILRFTRDRAPVREFAELIDRYRENFKLVFMRGDDWMDFPARQVVDDSNIPIEFISYTKGVSSTSEREGLRK